MKLSSLNFTKWKLPEDAKARLGKGSIKEIAYSPDGNLLAIASSIGIWLYDVETGEELDLLMDHSVSTNSVCFSRNRVLIRDNKNEVNCVRGYYSGYHRILASGDSNGEVHLWDVETGTKIKTLADHNTPVLSVCFSPDGKTIASGSAGWTGIDGQIGVVNLWDVEKGTLQKTLRASTPFSGDSVNSVRFSPDGKTIASGRGRWYDFDNEEWQGGPVELWDVESGKLIKTLYTYTSSVNSMSFNDDGLLAVGCGDGIVYLWNVKTRELIKRLEGHWYDAITSVIFIDENRLLAASSDGTVRLWDVETEKHIAFTGHRTTVTSVSFNDKNYNFATSSEDGTIGFWYGIIINAPRPKAFITAHNSSVNSVAFSKNNCLIASGCRNGSLCLWDTESNTQIINLIGHTDYVTSVTFSPDNRFLASGGGDGTLRLWNIEDHTNIMKFGAQLSELIETGIGQNMDNPEIIAAALSGTDLNIKVLTGHTDAVRSVSFSPNGHLLASGSGIDSFFGSTKDYTVRLWDVETGKHIKTLTGHKEPIGGVCFSPDGQILASGSWDKTVSLWDIETGKLIKTLIGHTDHIWSICFSPDGQTLASCGREHIVRLWNVETGELIKTLIGHTSHVNSVSFSCNNRILTSGSYDKSVCLWNVTTGEPIKTFTGHTGAVYDVSFSSDGNTVVSGSEDGTMLLWEVPRSVVRYPNINPCEIRGNWRSGWALDIHTISSRPLQDGGYDTDRTEFGELVFK